MLILGDVEMNDGEAILGAEVISHAHEGGAPRFRDAIVDDYQIIAISALALGLEKTGERGRESGERGFL